MNILTELEKLRIDHTDCEDGWYSCPKAKNGCLDDRAGDACNCGADEHNAILDGVIAYMRSNYGKQFLLQEAPSNIASTFYVGAFVKSWVGGAKG